jgi:hypothetical protein
VTGYFDFDDGIMLEKFYLTTVVVGQSLNVELLEKCPIFECFSRIFQGKNDR